MGKLHKQVRGLSVCLLSPYLAFKSVARRLPGRLKPTRALKPPKVDFSGFLQKAADLKSTFTSHVINVFMSGNTIIYHLKSMPNKLWYKINDSAGFSGHSPNTEMLLVLKITKDSKLFHVRIWSKKRFVCQASVRCCYCLTTAVMRAYFPTPKFLIAYLFCIEAKKCDIL